MERSLIPREEYKELIRAVPPLPGTKPDGVIVTDMMQKLGFNQPTYDADQSISRDS